MQETHPSARQDAKVIGVVGVAHGASHFFHLILAPLFPWLREAFGLGGVELGLLMTAFFVVSGVAQALAGFVVDRHGPYVVLCAGVGLLAVSALGLSLSHSYPALLFFSALAGLGNSVFHPADYTLLNALVNPKRLGHAFSVHGISGNLGWAAAPVFLGTIAALAGWRWALLGAALLALLLLAALLACRTLLCPPTVRRRAAPALHGGEQGAGALGFLALPTVWMCFLFFVITSMALGGIQSFAPAALRELYGMPLALATACITAYMLASAAGMLLGGFLAGQTSSHERVVAAAFAVAAVLAVVIATGALPTVLVPVLFGLMGCGFGIAGPSRDLMVRAAAPRGATGRVYGVVYSGLDVGLSFAPPLFGALMDAHHTGGVFLLIGLFQLLAMFSALGVGFKAMARRAQVA